MEMVTQQVMSVKIDLSDRVSLKPFYYTNSNQYPVIVSMSKSGSAEVEGVFSEDIFIVNPNEKVKLMPPAKCGFNLYSTVPKCASFNTSDAIWKYFFQEHKDLHKKIKTLEENCVHVLHTNETKEDKRVYVSFTLDHLVPVIKQVPVGIFIKDKDKNNLTPLEKHMSFILNGDDHRIEDIILGPNQQLLVTCGKPTTVGVVVY